jgi:hypothetical protein
MKRRLKEQNQPPMTIIAKLFEILNKEKKKNKTRASLLNAIKEYMPYFNIPEGYELYLLELYVLNYRKDGDYSELKKNNFIDPRYERGKTTSNPRANLYTIAQIPFKGSNLQAYWTKDRNGVPYYKVESYGWYPVYIFKEGKWYEVLERYSSSTSRQMSNANPVEYSKELSTDVYTLTRQEMRMLEQGYSHEEIMKKKIESLKDKSPELTKRKKTAKIHDYYFNQDQTPNSNIKFKVNSVDIEGDKAIVNVDVYDVLRRVNGAEIDTPQNYLRGEIPNLTKEKVENEIKTKLRRELRDYIGKRINYRGEDVKDSTIEFRFNHLKK